MVEAFQNHHFRRTRLLSTHQRWWILHVQRRRTLIISQGTMVEAFQNHHFRRTRLLSTHQRCWTLQVQRRRTLIISQGPFMRRKLMKLLQQFKQKPKEMPNHYNSSQTQICALNVLDGAAAVPQKWGLPVPTLCTQVTRSNTCQEMADACTIACWIF